MRAEGDAECHGEGSVRVSDMVMVVDEFARQLESLCVKKGVGTLAAAIYDAANVHARAGIKCCARLRALLKDFSMKLALQLLQLNARYGGFLQD